MFEKARLGWEITYRSMTATKPEELGHSLDRVSLLPTVSESVKSSLCRGARPCAPTMNRIYACVRSRVPGITRRFLLVIPDRYCDIASEKTSTDAVHCIHRILRVAAH